jgi:hypothetical protein
MQCLLLSEDSARATRKQKKTGEPYHAEQERTVGDSYQSSDSDAQIIRKQKRRTRTQ